MKLGIHHRIHNNDARRLRPILRAIALVVALMGMVLRNLYSTGATLQISSSSATPASVLPSNATVQALPARCIRQYTRYAPKSPIDRPLYFKSTSIPPWTGPPDNRTINPKLPSAKVDNATMWNLEIPVNYSIEATMTSTIPWSNVSTLAHIDGYFYSGYRNQMMAFTMLVLQAVKEGYGQLLLCSLCQKDTYGTDRFIPFATLWDVPHWNSYYPHLPRLVDYDSVLHSQFNCEDGRFYKISENGWFGTYGLFASEKPMRPFVHAPQHNLMAGYIRYASRGRGPYAASPNDPDALAFADARGRKPGRRNPAEILMFEGAMRPHPDLQAVIDRILEENVMMVKTRNGTITDSSTSLAADFMTLHARVEPDMQKHVVCWDKKVLNLTDIFAFLETKWHDPPVSKIFIPINRQYMEREAKINRVKPEETNWIAYNNLRALNSAVAHGLWGGRVKVVEFGAKALMGTPYAEKPSTPGAMLNFFLGIRAKIFVGSEVSSFAHDLLATRFYRGYTKNYKYLPSGLAYWTPPGTVDPPGFRC